MRWYRATYFRIWQWYRDLNGPEGGDRNAVIILMALHAMNVLAVRTALQLPLTHPTFKVAPWVLVAGLLIIGPPLWCYRHAEEIRKDFDKEESKVNLRGRVTLAVYGISTALLTIAATL